MSLQTTVQGAGDPITLDRTEQVHLIGERINPRPDSDLAAALSEGNMEPVRELAVEQVENGADLIDVNVDADGVDKDEILPKAVETVADAVDVPIVIDTNYEDADALEEALQVCPGKPVVNSVNGEQESLETILPLVAEYETAVIGLTMDDDGIPNDAETRFQIAETILARAAEHDIPEEDVIVDCAALPLSTDSEAGRVTLDTMEKVRDELGNNITLGLSNVSFELPNRELINNVFFAMAVNAGLNVPIIHAESAKETALVADLAMGRDDYATRYLGYYRGR
ncbi:Methionine synthase I, cobalamin-binding domain [Halalkaliarchaeum sp. AArc-CO]|uniref:dihydropteroate synthase n=1 Tax=unclassified Halalkaliarchaeum TaxID=2678344 RepID=UPI00217DA328|nr:MULTISPECIES: dihydropteroate synthase [unclassified Halalkaliarchaeum]MDR5674200.1 dihydropteroate synthase [Halalkaliarchaeum sp. AArc-GB]UWG50918.1 Methionine synthase I, cobalamin-binding domain [Halalkaliarchaeum sp. AArc-CO]